MSIYMYASGAQGQVMTIVSHLGLSESYSNLIAKASKPQPPAVTIKTIEDEDATSASSNPVTDNPQIQPIMKKKPPRPRQAGTLCSLSESMHASMCTVALTGLLVPKKSK